MGSGKKKIEIKKIDDKNKSFVAFSKRTRGLFKKAHEFCKIPGRRFAGVVFSPTENIYVDGDLTLVQRYSRTTVAAVDVPTVAENGGEESALASLIPELTTGVDEIDDVNELIRRKDHLDECKDKIVKKLEAMQPAAAEEANELLQQANSHARRDQDCTSHESKIIEEASHPLEEIKFLFGVEIKV